MGSVGWALWAPWDALRALCGRLTGRLRRPVEVPGRLRLLREIRAGRVWYVPLTGAALWQCAGRLQDVTAPVGALVRHGWAYAPLGSHQRPQPAVVAYVTTVVGDEVLSLARGGENR